MPIIDLSFVLVGTTFPLDHGYSLFSAICRVVPGLHGDRRIGVHPIRGRQTAPGVLTLDDRSRLKLRLPSEEIAPYIALAGQALELEDHRLQVGIPRVEALIPAANLASRLVTFRHALTPSDLEEDVRRELARLEVSGTPHFVPSSPTGFRGSAAEAGPEGQGKACRRVRLTGDRIDCGGVHPPSRGGAWGKKAYGVRSFRAVACGVISGQSEVEKERWESEDDGDIACQVGHTNSP